MSDRSDVLFVGWGGPEGVSHYRTILPARQIGAEWVIFDMSGRPTHGEGSSKSHKVIVVQNCWNDWQLKMVLAMKKTGATVLMNIDDWIKGIGRRTTAHGNHALFADKETLRVHERLLRETDGIIASTDWLAERLRRYNDRVAVARNGIDPKRYQAWMDVERDMGVIVGWAGGTGHSDALRSIQEAVSDVVEAHDEVSLWIVGQDETHLFRCEATHRPWTDMHIYPKDLACFDINLAPSLNDDFYRAKSQLRLYEAWTLGTPTIGGGLYDEITDGLDGYIAHTPDDWRTYLDRLITDRDERAAMRANSLVSARGVTIERRRDEWTRAVDGGAV